MDSRPKLTRSLLITITNIKILSKCSAEKAAIGKAKDKHARGRALMKYLKCRRGGK